MVWLRFCGGAVVFLFLLWSCFCFCCGRVVGFFCDCVFGVVWLCFCGGVLLVVLFL